MDYLKKFRDILAALGVIDGKADEINGKADEIMGRLDVPPSDAVNNSYVTDVVGNKEDTSVYSKADTYSLMRYNKGLIDMLRHIEKQGLPRTSMFEGWQTWDDADNIITDDRWIVSGDGVIYKDSAAGLIYVHLDLDDGENIRFISRQKWWQCLLNLSSPNLPSANHMFQQMNLEFNIILSSQALLQAGDSLWGWSKLDAATSVSDNLIGFVPIPTGVRSLVRANGATVDQDDYVVSGTPNLHKLRISTHFEDDAGDTHIVFRFWIDETLVREFNPTQVQVPIDVQTMQFYNKSVGGVAALEIGQIRAWTQEESTYGRYC